MIALLNSLFASLSPLWEMSVTAAYAAAVVAVLRFVLKKRAPKQVLCLLWLVVFARLLVPVSLESPLSLIPDSEQARVVQDLPSRLAGGEQTAPVQPPAQSHAPAQNSSGSGAENPGAPGDIAPDAVPLIPVLTSLGDAAPAVAVQPEAEPQSGFPWQALLAGVWLAGALAMGGYGLISYLRLKGRLYDAIRAEDGAWEHPSVSSPFILGVFRPRIYLPAGLWGQPRRFILCHERAHLRRLDHIVKPLCWVALALHWFNPAVWAAFILMSRDIEAACDEAVIRRLGPRVKADYSATLLSLATNGRVPAPCPLAFDEGDAKGRIKNVLRYRRPAMWIVVVSAVMAVLAAVCLLTDPVSAGEPDPDASQTPGPSPTASQGLEDNLAAAVLDPWMREVLNGERQFISAYSQYAEGDGRTYSIHDLRTFYYGDDQFPDAVVEAGKLAVIDLDRDGVSELVVWPEGDNKYLYSVVGYLILHRQGDEVYGYNPVYRGFGDLKADGTFSWSNGAAWSGYATLSFGPGEIVLHETTYHKPAENGYDQLYFVDGEKATREEFEAAITAQNAKPDPVWYVFQNGRLSAPIRVPIPLDEFAQAAPVPSFLTEEQQLLYRQMYSLYSHIFGPNTESVDDWPDHTGLGSSDVVRRGADSYTPATGLYAKWADFEQAVLSVFTQDFWSRLNGANGDETYINEGGTLYYRPGARGNNGNNPYFPETFRLVEQTEDSIIFITTAYYTENPGYVPEEGWDAYLRAHYDYVQDFPIHIVKTENGWRFDQFYCPMTDYQCYRLTAYSATPRRPDSLENHRPGALTQEELDYFNRYFDMGLARLPSIRSMLLMSEYGRPEDIDLYTTFYHGLDAYPEISQAEYDALGWNEYGEKFKVTTAQMNAVLQLYTGLTLEQTSRVGLDSFRYLPETDAYYTTHQDTASELIDMRSGRYNQDGTISLTYRHGELEGQYRTVTLERADGQYYRVLSNQPAAAPEAGGGAEPSANPSAAPSAAPTASAATVCEHGLDDIRLEYVGSQLVARCNQDGHTYPIPGVTSANYEGDTGIADGGGWLREELDGDNHMEIAIFTGTGGGSGLVVLDVENGVPVTSTLDTRQMTDAFNNNVAYDYLDDLSTLEVSYLGQTAQSPVSEGWQSEMRNRGGGWNPEVWPTEARATWTGGSFLYSFPVFAARGYQSEIIARWHVAYSAGGGLQVGDFSMW